MPEDPSVCLLDRTGSSALHSERAVLLAVCTGPEAIPVQHSPNGMAVLLPLRCQELRGLHWEVAVQQLESWTTRAERSRNQIFMTFIAYLAHKHFNKHLMISDESWKQHEGCPICGLCVLSNWVRCTIGNPILRLPTLCLTAMCRQWTELRWHCPSVPETGPDWVQQMSKDSDWSPSLPWRLMEPSRCSKPYGWLKCQVLRVAHRLPQVFCVDVEAAHVRPGGPNTFVG